MEGDKKEFSGMKKNARIKQSLFRDKRKNKGKGKKGEDEDKEMKRIKKTLEEQISNDGQTIEVKRFADLPISRRTLNGLKDGGGFTKPTPIQREALPLALRGLDILGAAKTGSGKTLAFLIPVLEKLWHSKWTALDGLGALVLSPTRELAYQTFETLRSIGKRHDFSAGLIIGGKDLAFERKRMETLNIVIATPGRLLQHMDENPSFNVNSLQMLVLDEADRILDLGFERDVNAILEALPKTTRQTLLFSATQTKSVRDLARLSLRSPVYVGVDEGAATATPDSLSQSYIVVPLEEKIDLLWSFIRHHRHKKSLVFMSSCKEVRFVALLFCRLRPGLSVLALHGDLHQLKRMSVYDEFTRKESAVLIATDVAARGLDFPGVDWVIQLDCPEDVTTYIHRVGRTARYNRGGEALLVLTPSEEEGMVESLTKRGVALERIEPNKKKCMSIRRKAESLLARDTSLKEAAQRAFKAYLKSIYLMKDKATFDLSKISGDELAGFARSMGLAVAPRVRFLEKKAGVMREVTTEESGGGLNFDVDDEDDEEDLFVGSKRVEVDAGDEFNVEQDLSLGSSDLLTKGSKKKKSKAALAKRLIKKGIAGNTVVKWDEDGEEVVQDPRRERTTAIAKEYEKGAGLGGIDVETAKAVLREEDAIDKAFFRERIRAKHREERLKKRSERKGKSKEEDEEADATVYLGGRDDDDSGEEGEGPDLSWLPDPDKIYNQDHDNIDEDEGSGDDGGRIHVDVVCSSDEDSEEEEEPRPPPAKKSRSKVSKVKSTKNRILSSIKDLNKLDDSVAMEHLALSLLKDK